MYTYFCVEGENQYTNTHTLHSLHLPFAPSSLLLGIEFAIHLILIGRSDRFSFVKDNILFFDFLKHHRSGISKRWNVELLNVSFFLSFDLIFFPFWLAIDNCYFLIHPTVCAVYVWVCNYGGAKMRKKKAIREKRDRGMRAEWARTLFHFEEKHLGGQEQKRTT